MKRCLLLTVGLLSLSIAYAETKAWNTTSGGAFDADGNWKPSGVPGADDDFYLTGSQSAPITLTESVDVAGNVTANWNVFKETAFDGELALGSGHILNLLGSARKLFNGSFKFRLTSGTFRIGEGEQVIMCDNAGSNAKISVDGPDAKFICVPTMNTRTGGTNWWIEAVNGGAIEAKFDLAYTGGNDCHLRVAGVGSKWLASSIGSSYLGRHGFGCHLDVEDRGVFESPLDFYVGGLYNRGYAAKGGRNAVKVDGGTLVAGKGLFIGYDTCSNRMDVVDGGQVFVAGTLSIGHQRYDWQNGTIQDPNDNKVVVAGADSLVSVTGTVYMPYRNASGSCLTVKDGASFVGKDKITIGFETSYAGAGNEIAVANGATLSVPWLNVYGSANVLAVEDASVSLSEGLQTGLGGAGTGNDTIRISGRSSSIFANRTKFNRGTTVDVLVPEGGFSNPLFSAASYFDFGNADGTKTKIVVRLAEDLKHKTTFTLFKSTGTDILPAAGELPANVEFELPRGATLDLNNKKEVKVTVRPDTGLILILR